MGRKGKEKRDSGCLRVYRPLSREVRPMPYGPYYHRPYRLSVAAKKIVRVALFIVISSQHHEIFVANVESQRKSRFLYY